MVQRNRSMHIARCLSCRVLGLTLHTAGLRNTLLSRLGVLPTCVQGLAEPGSRGLGMGENNWTSFWGLVLLLLSALGFTLGAGIVTVVGVHPAPAVYFPSRGPARWAGGRRWRLSRRRGRLSRRRRSLTGACGIFLLGTAGYA